MNNIKINKRYIGSKFKPYVIVEACVNHQGDFSTAKKMIYYSKSVGADAIKFQHHILEEEMLKVVPKSGNFKTSLWEVIKKTNFTLSQHKMFKKLCDRIGIEYLCTPFSMKAVDELKSIGVRAFKTGSGELTNHPFIEHIAKIGKPMILSTGMSNPEEISESVNIIKKYKTPFSLMHCVSAYPCPYNIMNLNFINTLEKKYKVPVGLSDHTPTFYTSLGASSLGASLIEKHFTFNKKLIFTQEKEIVNWARESVVTIKNISKGEKFTKNNISVKRPTPKKGEIPAKFYKKVLNSKSKVNLKKDVKIKWTQVKR